MEAFRACGFGRGRFYHLKEKEGKCPIVLVKAQISYLYVIRCFDDNLT